MKFVRRALAGAFIGALVWLCVLIIFVIFFQERISSDTLVAEVGVVSLIGAIIGMASLVTPGQRIRTLRDMQEEIERGEYIAKLRRRYIREIERGEGIPEMIYHFCALDGTIWEQGGGIANCPNPNHPNPPPVRVPNIGFFYLSVGSICFALAYGIFTNEALLTLAATALLLITTAVIFTVLFLVLATIARLFQIEVIPTRLLGIAVSVLAALFAMILVSLWRGQFPSITWWVIELAITYLIEIFFTNSLASWALRW